MSNYNVITDFAAKDSLSPGDPNKVALGVDIAAELTAIATAISSKENSANKGIAGGYAALNGSGKLADSYFPSALPAVSGAALTGLLEANIADGAVFPRLGASETITGLWNFTTQPTINSVLVGYLSIPQNAQTGDYTLVLGDSGKHVYKASGGAGETITIPANASVAYPVGTAVTFVNQGGGALTIAITSDTMTLAGTGATGSRTLADDGICTALKVASTEWIISGSGLT